MAFGINKVILIGNVGSAPEVKTASNGGVITKLSLATSESYTDSNTKEKVTKTEWHNINIYGKLAQIASDYVRKGHKLYILGKLNTYKYKNDAGVEKKNTVIIATEMQILSSKSDFGNVKDNHEDKHFESNSDHQNIDFVDIPF